MQRGSATPLIFFVIALVFGLTMGTLFFYQTKSDSNLSQTINLQAATVQTTVLPQVQKPVTTTYKNSELGFEFSYKSGQNLVKQDSEKDFFIRQNGDARKNFTTRTGRAPAEVLGAFDLVDKSDGSIDAAPFTVWVFKNSDNLDVDGWFSQNWYYPFIWGLYDWSNRNQILPKNEATVSGILAKYGLIAYQNNTKLYLIPQNDRMFLIKVIGEVGDQTLASFKLVQ